MKHYTKLFLVLIPLLLFPGCRYYCWLKDVFDQGVYTDDFSTIPSKYVRSARIYDQLATLGIFDVLWLHDEVRIAYAQAYAEKHCLNEEQYERLLQRQFAENEQFINFYVLAAYPGQEDNTLNERDSFWAICLESDGQMYQPTQIKLLKDLDPEYIFFFCSRFTVFKDIYLVRFNKYRTDGSPVIPEGTKEITMHFNRVGRKTCATWCLDIYGHAMKPRSWNKDVLAYDMYCQPC